jgi:hypothetical protein
MAINKAMLDEFNYFKSHQDEIVNGHIGELAVIKDHELRGITKRSGRPRGHQRTIFSKLF